MATDCDTSVQDMIGEELTVEQEHALLERETQRAFSLSVDEFRRRWEAGEYRHSEDPRVTQVAMLLY